MPAWVNNTHTCILFSSSAFSFSLLVVAYDVEISKIWRKKPVTHTTKLLWIRCSGANGCAFVRSFASYCWCVKIKYEFVCIRWHRRNENKWIEKSNNMKASQVKKGRRERVQVRMQYLCKSSAAAFFVCLFIWEVYLLVSMDTRSFRFGSINGIFIIVCATLHYHDLFPSLLFIFLYFGFCRRRFRIHIYTLHHNQTESEYGHYPNKTQQHIITAMYTARSNNQQQFPKKKTTRKI